MVVAGPHHLPPLIIGESWSILAEKHPPPQAHTLTLTLYKYNRSTANFRHWFLHGNKIKIQTLMAPKSLFFLPFTLMLVLLP